MDVKALPFSNDEIGKHVIRVENGILQVLFSGRVSVEEAKRIQACVLEAGDRFGLLAALVDLDGLADFDSGSRAHFARPSRPYPFYAVAYYGGSFPVRVLILTVMRAGKLIVPKAFDFELQTFEKEAEARRFLETARAKRHAANEASRHL
ncbi:MAG: STAS/SEC14 domain-containing protein [Polyangiaceae bacterium]|nr:STAS/SEC14 domain-containing protein [Polyangiaceae bacterium]